MLHKVLCPLRHSEMSLRPPPCKPQPGLGPGFSATGRHEQPVTPTRCPLVPAPCSSGRGLAGADACGGMWRQVGGFRAACLCVPAAPPGGHWPEVVGITVATLSFPEKTGLSRYREKRAEERAEPHLVMGPHGRRSSHGQVEVTPVEREPVPACRVL